MRPFSPGHFAYFKMKYGHQEHIWWDHASALLQAGVIPSHVPHGDKKLRIPVAGIEGARLLVNEMDGTSNQMLGTAWGIQDE